MTDSNTEPSSLDDHILAIARGAVASAGVPADRVSPEVEGLFLAMRDSVARSQAGGVPEAEFKAMCRVFSQGHARLLSLAYKTG